MRIRDWSSDVCSSDLLEHDNALGILVAEQRQRIIRRLLQIAEGDNVTVGLDRVQNAIGARIGLDQPVRAQVLVHPECIERGSVETGQKHRSDEHTSELQSLMRNSYAVFCLTKKKNKNKQ